MRRRGVILSVGGIIGLSGCSSNASEESTSTQTPTQSETDSSENSSRIIEGMELSVSESMLIESYEAGGHVHYPDQGEAFLAVNFRAETIGEDPVSHPEDGEIVAISGTSQVESRLEHDSLTSPVSGSKYTGTDDARSGVVSEGWLIYDVSRDTESATISWSDTTSGEEVSWSVSFSPGNLPNVSVTGFSAPNATERYQDITISVSAENTGGSSGTINAEVDSDVLEDPIPIVLDVPGEESTETSITIEYPSEAGIGTQYELVDTNTDTVFSTLTVDYEIPERDFGESFTTPDGTEVTLSQLQFTEEIEYESEYSDPETAGSNQQLALVQVAFETDSDDGGTVPSESSLELESGENSYGNYGLSSYNTITSPVSGSAYSQFISTLSSDVSETGWLAFEVPDTVALEDVAVLWEYDSYTNTDISVRWN